MLDALPALRDAAESARARLALVGGAGSLHVSEGGPLLFDTPDFPAAFAGEAKAHGAVLEALREDTTGLDWLYLSPAASFGSYNPGERTGTYRLGGDVPLSDAEGRSDISGDDFALAFVDVLEDRTQSASARLRRLLNGRRRGRRDLSRWTSTSGTPGARAARCSGSSGTSGPC